MVRPSETTEPEEAINSPSLAKVQATISLLGDSDEGVVRRCQHQLLQWGDRARQAVENAAEAGDPGLRLRARSVLRSLGLRDWSARVELFAERLPLDGEIIGDDLEEGAGLLAGLHGPDGSSTDRLRVLLVELADEVRQRIEGRAGVTQARAFASFMANQLGFTGADEGLPDIRAAQLDEVLHRRQGVSVALCLAYILIGRRAGLRVTGLLLPDHALVRVHNDRPILLDPFHQGRCVTKADCIRFLRHHGYGLHTTSYLQDVPDRQILAALARRMHSVYGYREDQDTCAALDVARNALVGLG